MDKVNLFKDLFTTKDKNGKNVISDQFKEQIWKLFDAMIKISIKYIHRQRNPYSHKNDEGELIGAYGAEFMDEVDINYHATVWELKLEFPVNF